MLAFSLFKGQLRALKLPHKQDLWRGPIIFLYLTAFINYFMDSISLIAMNS